MFYDVGIKVLKTAQKETDEVRDLKLILYQNRAHALNSLEKYDEAIDCCRHALTINDKAVKALYRRSIALFKKGLCNMALTDIKSACDLAPKN